MLERQREGIAKATREGRHKGRVCRRRRPMGVTLPSALFDHRKGLMEDWAEHFWVVSRERR